MDETPQPALYSPEQDERTMAVLAHALQVVGWWIAPLVIMLARPNSKYIRFHALQAFLLQILHLLFWGAVMVAYFAFIFAVVVKLPKGGQPPPPALPAAMFVVIIFAVLIGWGFWLLGVLAAILYSLKAGRGEWANYPLLGTIARRFLGLPESAPPEPLQSNV